MNRIYCHKLLSWLLLSLCTLNLWGQSPIQERVEIHVDRDLYMVGDLIWAKVYLRDALLGQASQLSRIVQVELWDSRGHMILQGKVLLSEGTGALSMEIPTNQPSGHFQLRAYSKWMANASSDRYAHKNIRIFNPADPLPISDKQKISEKKVAYVDLFPEGGHLLHNIENRVGVKIRDEYGRPKEVVGRIEEADGTVVSAFETQQEGLTSFQFTPDTNKTYVLRILGAMDSSKVYALSPTQKSGATMRVETQNNARIHVQVSALAVESAMVLQVSKGGHVCKEEPVDASRGLSQHSFSLAELPKGELLLQILTEAGEVLAGRYVSAGSPQALGLDVNLSKTRVGKREKVRIEIQSSKAAGQPTIADLGISVVQKPGEARQAEERRKSTVTDLHMLCKPISTGKGKKGGKYFPELFGLSLSGSIKNYRPQTQAPVRVVLSFPGKVPYVRTTQVDEFGRFDFKLEPLYGVREIGLLAVDAKGNPLTVELDPSHLGDPPFPSPLALRFSDSELDYLQKHFVQSQLMAAYRDSFPDYSAPIIPRMKPFYGFANKEYVLDEYTRFDTEETFNEIVYSVALRKKRGRFYFRVYNEEVSNLMKEKPLILFDGIPLLDANDLIKINSKRIEKIEVLTTIYYQDNLRFYGIVNVHSFKGDADIEDLPRSFVRKPHTFLSPGRTFNYKDYTTQAAQLKHIPDQRSLLLWAPTLKTDQTGKAIIEFYTSDVLGSYEVKVSGLSTDGLWGEARTELQVVAPGQ